MPLWNDLRCLGGIPLIVVILKQFPEIDLEKQKVGIFSKLSKLDAVLSEGDRVEIYRPITCDPKTVQRKAKAGDAASED